MVHLWNALTRVRKPVHAPKAISSIMVPTEWNGSEWQRIMHELRKASPGCRTELSALDDESFADGPSIPLDSNAP